MSALDRAAFAAVALVVTLVGILACYAPVRRATRVDAVRVLGAE